MNLLVAPLLYRFPVQGIQQNHQDDQSMPVLVDTRSGVLLRRLKHFPRALGPDAKLVAAREDSGFPGRGCTLFAGNEDTPLVRVGIEGPDSFPRFDSHGSLLAWPNADGTVDVCNLEEIRRRLTEFNMQWPQP